MKKRFFLNGKNTLSVKNERGQVWVETVIYTLVAFALIGLVLAFAKPKIEEIQDRGIIEQSINILEEIDLIIKKMGDPGNQRVVDLVISKGSLYIDGEKDKLFFKVDSKHEYSQLGEDVFIGNILVRTDKKANINEVTLTKDYSEEYDIKYQNTDTLNELTKAPAPYKIVISNIGVDAGKTIINIEVIN